jgi:hypothetical protein
VSKPPFGFIFEILTDSTQTIEGGQAAIYTFNLQNVGGEADSYNVIGDEPPGPSGWEAALDCSNPTAVRVSDVEFDIALGPGETAGFTYTITSPNDPDDKEMVLDLTSTSEEITEPSQKTKTHTTTTKIDTGTPPPGQVTLSSPTTTKVADPGDTIDADYATQVVFDITAENDDEFSSFSVDIELTNIPSNWDPSITPDNFDINPEATEDISLIIDIPETESAGNYPFKIKAKYGSGEEANLDLTVTIPTIYDIELETLEDEKTITAGKTVEFDVSVTNKGNVEGVKIELLFNEQSGWEVEIDRPVITLGDFDSVTNVKISVTPSESVDTTEMGIFDIQGQIQGSGTKIGEKITLKINVEKDTGEQLANFLYDYWFVPVMVIVIIILTLVIRSRLK